MSFQLIDTGWDHQLSDALRAHSAQLQFICPFIKRGALERLLKTARPGALQTITRFNLQDFAEGASDIAALRLLLKHGGKVRGVRNLHAKVYLFGGRKVFVTSANLTKAALSRNHEFGFVSDDAAVVTPCNDYFAGLWSKAGKDLTQAQLDAWEKEVEGFLASGGRPAIRKRLRDEGTNLGIAPPPLPSGPWVSNGQQAFVKFLGTGSNRKPPSFPTLDEVKRAGCHTELAYPSKKRPRGVQDGAIMFIARLAMEPTDIIVFGRAIGLAHVDGRDDATADDIARRGWRKDWPRYIRVHHPEFVAGTLDNGVSLNELMKELGPDSFEPTRKNLVSGIGNTDPRKAYMQQAAVELTPKALGWLNERLEASFTAHGKIPQSDLENIDRLPLVSPEGGAAQ